MKDSNDATIPLRLSNPTALDKNVGPLPQERMGWKLRRPSMIMFFIVLMMVIGWGAKNYFTADSSLDEDMMADVDGFESAAPFESALGQKEKSRSTNEANAILSAPSFNAPMPPNSPIMENVSTSVPLKGADVWLTGTIEDADSRERIELPPRITRGQSDSSAVR